MPDAVAAREAARRLRNGGRRAATHAGRHPRRWRARALASAVLAGACATGGIAWPPVGALAAGSAATAPLSQSPIPSPSLSLPGFHAPPSTSNGTVASGVVRTQPARMPFYVATKGKVTIYVLGTLHVGDPADYPQNQPFRRPILAALAASPTLALELSPDDLLESQDDVSKYGVCNYACLPRLLPPPLWQRLAGRLRGNPAALAGIRNMRPWLASLVVETYDSLSAGLQTEYGTEAQLQNVFLRKKGGKVVGLETLAEQMRAFTGLTLAQQREMLAQDMVQTPAQNAADVRALHRLWRIGDADALAAWATAKTERLARAKAVADSIDNKIVNERNRRFVARMTAIAAPNRPLFVAIGALHLGGPKGVLELLRQQGYLVDAG
ncbi:MULTISPECIES: TraB/GumN family protein [Burkholderia]|uniref:Polysaccharide biosynthesis protein GumN n=1 Tax=Burkholderia mayonis TaxID=1385591 RepID=A0A1B4FHW8_9BURK|nr:MULTISPECIES: TraB/GumN family protein [Burkholderia]AOJ03207.1 polysaccharide biosynthesis protein GumN [Burkholderia mayonis]KVE44562.1 polysaccharide biosynthesis protein GumN [Burkholderia sp. BDU5]KVE45380.1 polysaccharide biosynthesis protein GumN [Burkholderia mayonis]